LDLARKNQADSRIIDALTDFASKSVAFMKAKDTQTFETLSSSEEIPKEISGSWSPQSDDISSTGMGGMSCCDGGLEDPREQRKDGCVPRSIDVESAAVSSVDRESVLEECWFFPSFKVDKRWFT